jgi:hypothetical protein
MKKISVIVLLAGALVSGSVMADIYKWVDTDGNVHYGDRPTGAAMSSPGQIEQVAIASRRTDTAKVQAGVEARMVRDTQRSDARSVAAEEKMEAEQLKVEADERATKCSTYRERMQKFTNSRRLYRVDDNGEREYLNDTQMTAARAQVEKQVQEYCSS